MEGKERFWIVDSFMHYALARILIQTTALWQRVLIDEKLVVGIKFTSITCFSLSTCVSVSKRCCACEDTGLCVMQKSVLRSYFFCRFRRCLCVQPVSMKVAILFFRWVSVHAACSPSDWFLFINPWVRINHLESKLRCNRSVTSCACIT